jgi:phenylacetate-coenzyme A ligase PaaK-like adenylate-forming protein
MSRTASAAQRQGRVAADAADLRIRLTAPPFFDAGRCARAAADVWSAMWLDPEAMAKRARQRLTALLRFARTQVPLYRRLHRALPPPAQLQLADLPVLRKSQIMANLSASLADGSPNRAAIDAFLADPSQIGAPLAGHYAVWTSSGSTGVPGIFVHDGDALAVYDALELLRFRGLGGHPLSAAPFMAAERYAMVAAVEGHFAGIATVERLRRNFPLLAPYVRAFSVLQPLPQLVEALNRYRPTLLAAYPTVAELLADEQRAGRLRLSLDELWCGGECLSPATRSLLAQVFRCRVREAYGASEFLSIAWPCRYDRMHVNSDWVLLEGVDARGRPVPPGVPSRTTLLTNLANRVQPLIRYDIGDSITVLPQPCPCGSAMPAIEVQGRCDDVLAIACGQHASVKLMPLALATVLEDDALVNDFQLLQTGPRRLALRLGGTERARGDAACTALRAYLRRLDLADVRVELDTAAPRRDPASGKLRRVVNALTAAAVQ